MPPCLAPHSFAALWSTASSERPRSLVVRLISLSTSALATCWARASASSRVSWALVGFLATALFALDAPCPRSLRDSIGLTLVFAAPATGARDLRRAPGRRRRRAAAGSRSLSRVAMRTLRSLRGREGQYGRGKNCALRAAGPYATLGVGSMARAGEAFPSAAQFCVRSNGANAPLLLRRVLLRLFVGIDHAARRVFGRRHHDLGRGVPELGDVVALHVLELDLQHARLRPFTLGAERHVADHGLEGVGAEVVAELGIIQALSGLDGLLQHLQLGISPWRHVVAERIDAFRRRLGLVALDEVGHAGEIHLRHRQPEIVVDESVQQRPELGLDR